MFLHTQVYLHRVHYNTYAVSLVASRLFPIRTDPPLLRLYSKCTTEPISSKQATQRSLCPTRKNRRRQTYLELLIIGRTTSIINTYKNVVSCRSGGGIAVFLWVIFRPTAKTGHGVMRKTECVPGIDRYDRAPRPTHSEHTASCTTSNIPDRSFMYRIE